MVVDKTVVQEKVSSFFGDESEKSKIFGGIELGEVHEFVLASRIVTFLHQCKK